jgi:DnaJ homolog subfamily C member 17
MAPTPSPLDDAVDYYEFLSLPSDATEAEIQRAYRRTNLKYHPDKFKATSEISAEQAAAKLDLLQKILSVLKDPAKRASYDQSRKAKRLQDAAARRMESDRKRKKVELDEREARAAYSANGFKKAKTQAEHDAARFAEENLEKRNEMMRQRQEEKARQREAADAQTKKETPAEAEAIHRSVKITWAKEGEGLDIDGAALKEMCEAFGPVESVGLMKDKKRRVDGRKEKAVFGMALVVFQALGAAQETVRRGPWDGVESVTWAFTKQTDAG